MKIARVNPKGVPRGFVAKGNPTLHPDALLDDEKKTGFPWHVYADSERSSQVFCLSAFGTLRGLDAKDPVMDALFARAFPGTALATGQRNWRLQPEASDSDLLSEAGAQPTSIDMLCTAEDAVVAIESKFASDAAEGFGRCSQAGKRACAGFRGPGSDLRTGTSHWCRLEVAEGDRSARAYWTLGRRWFRPEIFARQANGEVCAMSGPNYQLMRNFLFAVTMAERDGKGSFAVLTIGPQRFQDVLSRQVDAFRRDVLQPAYADRIAFVDYETYAYLLEFSGDNTARDLAEFLRERMDHVLPAQADIA